VDVGRAVIDGFRRRVRHPVAGHVGSLAGAQVLGLGLGVLTTVVAARGLGPTDFGVAALLAAYPSLLWSFVGVKSTAVTTRYLASLRAQRDPDRLAAICKLGFLLDLTAALGAFLLIAATGRWVAAVVLHLPGMGDTVVLYAASLPFYSLTGTSGAILSAWGRFRTLAVLQVTERTLALAAVGAALVAGMGVRGYLLARASAQVGMGIAMATVTGRLLRAEHGRWWWRSSLGALATLRRELVGFFGWNYLAVTLSGLTTQLPLVFVGELRGPVEAGYLRLGASVVSAGSALEGALARVTYPILSERWSRGERTAVMDTLRRWTLEAGLPLALAVGAAIPLVPFLLPAVLGREYAAMVRGTQAMLGGAVVSLVFFHLNAFYYAAGRVALWTKAYALYALALVVLAWPSARAGGFGGVALVLGVGEVAFTLAMAAAIDGRFGWFGEALAWCPRQVGRRV
jgi:O-antigen/teichoic acid export membrane protein